MNTIEKNLSAIRQTLPQDVQLLCVSKFQTLEAIQAAYDAGERDFGESRVQELLLKHEALPKDIRWHFIGHLQTNKVKAILPFVYLIQSVDSLHLLDCIEQEAEKLGKQVNVLLEVHVAREAAKTGFAPNELPRDMQAYPFIHVMGIMGMASHTDDEQEWRRCFRQIKAAAQTFPYSPDTFSDNPLPKPVISMGMTEDYLVAIEEGSNMVRIGSAIFGERDYSKPA